MMGRSGAVFVAPAADAIAGEPPTPLHPTVWMGGAIAAARRHAPVNSRAGVLAAGCALSIVGIAAAAGISYLGALGISRLATARAPIVEGLALKPALSLRALIEAGLTVERALGRRSPSGSRAAGQAVPQPNGAVWHVRADSAGNEPTTDRSGH